MAGLAGLFGRSVRLVWEVAPGYVAALAPTAILRGLIPAAQLYVSKRLIDLVAGMVSGQAIGGGFQHLLILLVAQAGLGLGSSTIGTWLSYLDSLAGERLQNELKHRILGHGSEMDVSSFERADFYDAMQNAYQEASTRPLQMVSQARGVVQSGVSSVSLAIMVTQLSGWVLPILLATSLPSFLVQRRVGFANYHMLRARAPQVRQQQYVAHVLRTDTNVHEVRLFGLEHYFLQWFGCLFHDFLRESKRILRGKSLATIAGAAISNLGILGCMGFLAVATLHSNVTVGSFALYAGAITQFQGQLGNILTNMSGLHNHSLFMANLFDFLDQPPSGLDDGAAWTGPIESVEFRGVSFKYPGSEVPALQDVSFTVRRGEILAVVGPNGAGKSTISNLLAGLYTPTTGKILLNGQDVAGYSRRSLQRSVAVVFQDFGRYQLTAQQNVELGRHEHAGDTKRFEKAITEAQAGFITSELPQGAATQLGKWFEGGQELSGGQWQKVALARMRFRAAPLVVLDEPTAALDAESEEAVYQRLSQDRPHRITVLVSHRFPTIRRADRVLVLRNGKVVEEGAHAELVAQHGPYWKAYSSQSAAFRDDDRGAEQPVGDVTDVNPVRAATPRGGPTE